ncbi:MAG TPA: hypothetical protein VHP33_07980 [Polyangiaceae bacterium]|nr:hypothetical protein [Polyangiaceae bacterium]
MWLVGGVLVDCAGTTLTNTGALVAGAAAFIHKYAVDAVALTRSPSPEPPR